MRPALINLIKKTIICEYYLPNAGNSILKTHLTTDQDHCYRADDQDKLVEIIYNSIVDYSFNEFDLAQKDLDNLLAIALKTKLKYNPAADDTTKLKYGFFGEVLLYAILLTIYKARPLIARGYFYNPLEKEETKGYDSYQLIDNNGKPELWFGEVKFHISHQTGIDSVMNNITKALSDTYLENNVMALYNHKNNLNIPGSAIETILDNWERQPNIRIIDEIRKYQMTLVYPIMILYEHDGGNYDDNIKKIPEYLAGKYATTSFELSIPYKLFFIILPLAQVKAIKTDVIQWIESKKPLTL